MFDHCSIYLIMYQIKMISIDGPFVGEVTSVSTFLGDPLTVITPKYTQTEKVVS